MDGAAPGRHTAGLNASTMREGVHLKLVASRRRRDAIKHSGTAAENNGVRIERACAAFAGPEAAELHCEPGRLFPCVALIDPQLSFAIPDRRLNRRTDILGSHVTKSYSKVVDPHQDVSLLLHQLSPDLS